MGGDAFGSTKPSGQQVTRQTGTTESNTSSDVSGLTGGTFTNATAAQIPDWLKGFIGGATNITGQSALDLQRGTNQYQLPPETLNALRSTAGGQFLYGGQGQQPFIDAAVRAASPGIFSAFGLAGRGGGGLEHAALNQSAVDAYANLYNQERGRQMEAATALPGVTTLPLTLQQQLLSSAGMLPGQFSSLFGQSATGQTAGTSNVQQQGTTSGTTSGKNLNPLYDPGWGTRALGIAALAGSFIPGSSSGSAAAGLLAPSVGPSGGASPYSGNPYNLPWLGQR